MDKIVQTIVECLRVRIDEEVELSNQRGKEAIIIKKEKYAPLFYTEDIHRMYESGESLTDIIEYIIDHLNDSAPELDDDFSFDHIKGDLIAKVVDRKRYNVETMVSTDLGADLSIIYGIDRGNYLVIISKDLAEQNGYDVEEIKALSRRTPVLERMEDALSGIDRNLLEEETIDEKAMLVLQAKEQFYGASTLFNEGVMESIHDKVGDYFILPASIHEVIILPDNGKRDIEDLRKTVVSANRAVVEPREILSDSVFRYDGEFKRVV